jgi:hypothetical protein
VVQQLKWTGKKGALNETWHTEHKRQKNRMGSGCMLEDSEEV